jgi:taurine dioxygenase
MKPQNTRNLGNAWHTGFTFQDMTPLAALLHVKELPLYRGDTMFANMYLAYKSLSTGIKHMLGGLPSIATYVTSAWTAAPSPTPIRGQ